MSTTSFDFALSCTWPGDDRLLVDMNGNLWVKTHRMMAKQCTDKDGYRQFRGGYGIPDLSVRVHRIVAETFIDNPKDLSDVDHIDGNRTNNHISNLRWANRTCNLGNAIARPHCRKGMILPKNVYFAENKTCLIVRVMHNHRAHHGGTFYTVAAAEKAAHKLRRRLYGEFARDE